MGRMLVALLVLLLAVSCSTKNNIAENSGVPERDTLSVALADLNMIAKPNNLDSSEWDSLKSQLADVLKASAGTDGKFVSTPPQDARSQMTLTLEGGELSWYYYSTGDYNQDGLVAVTDITPLGQNFNQSGPFDPTTAISAVDGNQDGSITVNDLTPIGQSYNRQVVGYRVYGSDSDTDYPTELAEDNGSGTLIETVAFTTATGTTADRKMFSYTPTQTFGYYWVRPVDSADDEGISSTMVAGNSTLEINAEAYTFSETLVPGTGMAGPVNVFGYPAQVLIRGDFSSNELVFIRAEDTYAETWGSPVVIADDVDGYPAVAVYNNIAPAVAYMVQGTKDLKLSIADDATGTSWKTPIVLDDTNHGAGVRIQMLEAAGNPAVCYIADGSSSDEDRLLWLTANNVDGTDWPDTPAIVDPEYVNDRQIKQMSAAIVDGHPAVFYRYENWSSGQKVGLCYCRSQNAAGTAWNSPVTILERDREDMAEVRNVSLIDLNGVPAVGWYKEDFSTIENSTFMFSIGSDANGGTFSSPVDLNQDHTTGHGLVWGNLAFMNSAGGTPLACLFLDRKNDENSSLVEAFFQKIPDTGSFSWEGAVNAKINISLPAATSSVSGKSASCFLDSCEWLQVMFVLAALTSKSPSDLDEVEYVFHGLGMGFRGPDLVVDHIKATLPGVALEFQF